MTNNEPSGTTGPTVLVVEDDRVIASSLRLLLERHGCAVRTAQSIEQAKIKLDSGVRRMVLDLMLPDGMARS